MPTDSPNLVRPAHRIAIVKLSSLGDVLHASGAAAAIKQTNPEAWLAWVVQDAFADLLRGNPHIDELIVVPFPGGLANLRHLKQAGLALREEKVDLVIDLQGLLKSAYVSWLSKAPERCSAADAREGGRFAANHYMTCPKGIGGAGKQLQYVASIGADISGLEMELTATEEARAEAARLLASGGLGEGVRFAAIVPASTRQTKEWPPERFAELARRLYEELGLLPVFIGGRKDEALSARLLAQAGVPGLNLSGKTSLQSLIAVGERASLTVGGDTGPVFILAVAGSPAVGLFGSTSFAGKLPSGPQWIALWDRQPCYPCHKSYCDRLDCMKSLTVDRVMATARQALEAAGQQV